MSSPCASEIRPGRAADERALLAGFAEAFAAVDADFSARDAATWRHRFLGAPQAARVLLALDGPRVLAQYATLGQRLDLHGELFEVGHAVDSFAVAGAASLARGRLFVELGRRFAEHYCGDGGLALVWGLPVRAAWRLGKRALRYESVRNVLKLAASARDERVPAEITLEVVTSLPCGVDVLCEQARVERGVSIVRNRAELTWRYLDTPTRGFAVVLARSGRILRGLAVARAGRFDGERAFVLGEWLVPCGDDVAAHALRAWARGAARAAGCERVVTHFAECSREWLAFQRAGWRVEPTRYPLVARSFHRRLDLDRLRDEWCTTLGDTDLFA